MSQRRPTIFLSAAEASGDDHAANLVAALRRRCPEARLVGLAGPKMASAGCEVLEDVTQHAGMTLSVLPRLLYWRRLVRRTQKAIREIRPDVHIPVDSPAMNWHLAEAARQAGSKVLYYIAPQVWAWAPWRAKKLARLTDQVACILPFEETFLRHRGVNACFVGHPLLDTLPPQPSPPDDLLESWSAGTWRVALLPGSRASEIAAHGAALAAVRDEILRRWPAARCTFTARTQEDADRVRRAAGRADIDVAVGRTREVLAESHFAVVVSGTVTLEAAYYGVPMLIVYRTGRLLGHVLGPLLVHAPHLSLVNILAGRELAPELMPWFGKPRPLVDMAMELMDDLGWLVETRRELQKLLPPLRAPNGLSAADNAAELAMRML